MDQISYWFFFNSVSHIYCAFKMYWLGIPLGSSSRPSVLHLYLLETSLNESSNKEQSIAYHLIPFTLLSENVLKVLEIYTSAPLDQSRFTSSPAMSSDCGVLHIHLHLQNLCLTPWPLHCGHHDPEIIHWPRLFLNMLLKAASDRRLFSHLGQALKA